MYDKNPLLWRPYVVVRGHADSSFDMGPHISFTKDTRIQDLFAESVDQKSETMQAQPE